MNKGTYIKLVIQDHIWLHIRLQPYYDLGTSGSGCV